MNKPTSALLIIIALGLAQSTEAAEKKKPPVGVPLDAQHFNGKWYRLYTEEVNWEMAERRCKILGGSLAIAPDEPTWLFLRPLTKNLSVWLGASDAETEGLWKWIDGTPMKFTAWHRKQPDNKWGVQDHLVAVRGGWDDGYKKHKQVGFICEWPDR